MNIDVKIEILENKSNPEKPLIKLTFENSREINFGHYNDLTIRYGDNATVIFDNMPLVKELRFNYVD